MGFGLVGLDMRGILTLFIISRNLLVLAEAFSIMSARPWVSKYQNTDMLNTLVIKEMSVWEKEEIPPYLNPS